jgi:hypothetical protein
MRISQPKLVFSQARPRFISEIPVRGNCRKWFRSHTSRGFLKSTTKLGVIDSGLVGSTDFHSSHPQGYGEGCRESRTCSRDIPTQSHILPGILVYQVYVALFLRIRTIFVSFASVRFLFVHEEKSAWCNRVVEEWESSPGHHHPRGLCFLIFDSPIFSNFSYFGVSQ